MASNPITKVTAEEYLAMDRAAELRSEFLDGEIIANVGRKYAPREIGREPNR